MAEEHIEFEFGGSFDTPNTPEHDYFWIAKKVDGKYADESMFFVVAPLTLNTEESLHHIEEDDVEGVFKPEDCASLTTGTISIHAADEPQCFNLQFDDSSFQTVFKVNLVDEVPAVAIFAQHDPEEFGEPHFVDVDGNESDPVHVLEHEGDHSHDGDHSSDEEAGHSEDKEWDAMGAATVVLLVSLIGVIFLAPKISSLKNLHSSRFDAIVYAFSAGALLATAFFLVLFEPVHLLESAYTDETDIVWRWGVAILAGYISTPALGSLCTAVESKLFGSINPSQPAVHDATDRMDSDEEAGSSGVDKKAAASTPGAVKLRSPSEVQLRAELDAKRRVLFSILVGDSMHNFVDGVFIGVAFQHCSSSMGWTVAMSSVFHELAQEIADYQLLVNVVHMQSVKALGVNFLSGLFVMLGALIAIETDVSDEATALILCFGGGVYLQLGASEAMPRVYAEAKQPLDKLLALFSFCFAAMCIGLVLLDHSHCVAEGEEGGHAGHGH